ncbi:hypothetical protein ACIGO8_25105 [Streptomyces sp. NPDC053493]|uniref:hypothetical protein n=1 Tax=Streptomyces sp. NPDC053493 TaxID=3365705 RepID=UPI0037CF29CE
MSILGSSRRSLLRRAGLLGSALAVGAAAPAAAQEERHGNGEPYGHRRKDRRPTPVGSWSVTVTIEGVPDVEHAHYSFGADGQLILQTHRHTHTGIGTWEWTDDGFVYVTRGLRPNADGGLLSELRIRHTARFDADGGFTSTGTGQALDATGKVLMEVQSTAVGTRFGVDG